MTKLFQKFLSLTLTLLTIVSLCTGVFAGNVELDDEHIKFTDVNTTWTDTDLFNNFKGVMPGDTLTQEIEIKVNSKKCDYANITLTAVPHGEDNPLSEKVADKETVKSMEDFLSQLQLEVYKGEELLANFNGIDGKVSLGKIETGKSVTLKVVLKVPLDMDNDYANRVAEIDWVFAAEAITNQKITVMKVWDDNNYPKRPTSVKVNLIKTDSDGNSEVHESFTLNKSNQWSHTWSQLSDEFTWSVKEDTVPDGYDVRYTTTTNGSEVLVKIINHKDYTPYIPWYPTPDPKPDPKPEPEPEETEPEETQPEETEPEETEPETETEPEETEPPEEIPETRDLTVRKAWAEDKAEDRPTFVTVALYKGEDEVEKVTLDDWNDWSYTWTELDAAAQWTVLEVDIPLGYTPSYASEGDTVTITNNAILIQTGQLNWPIAVFGGLGLICVVGGVVFLTRKKHDDA